MYYNTNNVKGKGHPRTDHEGPEGEYSYTLSLTSALEGLGGQRHAPAALPPRKIRYPLYRRLGGPKVWSGRVRKISSPTGIRSSDRPARSESPYRLSYLDTYNNKICNNNFSYLMMDVKLASETSCLLRMREWTMYNVRLERQKTFNYIYVLLFISRYLMLRVSALSAELSSGCINLLKESVS